MYNEMYVAERIMECVAHQEYPKDRFDIQVLDDSTDETVEIVAKKVEELRARGFNIEHIHRVNRQGYKAGALQDAMPKVKADFNWMAIIGVTTNKKMAPCRRETRVL